MNELSPSGDYKKEDFVHSMKHCSSETINSSNPADRLRHKHGKDILKGGWKAVPYLIESLEKEQVELSKNNPDGKNNNRLKYISSRLNYLYKQAKNAR